jgi:hypothetical protein
VKRFKEVLSNQRRFGNLALFTWPQVIPRTPFLIGGKKTFFRVANPIPQDIDFFASP